MKQEFDSICSQYYIVKKWNKVTNSSNSVFREYFPQYDKPPTNSTKRRNVFTALFQVHRGLTVWLSSSDGRHVPSRWEKSWHWRKGEKQQSQEVKNGGIREIHHHPTSLTLCRAWPYQAAGLSEWRNQVVGRAARPALVWEHARPWLHQSSWNMCIKRVLKVTISPFFQIQWSLFSHTDGTVKIY